MNKQARGRHGSRFSLVHTSCHESTLHKVGNLRLQPAYSQRCVRSLENRSRKAAYTPARLTLPMLHLPRQPFIRTNATSFQYQAPRACIRVSEANAASNLEIVESTSVARSTSVFRVTCIFRACNILHNLHLPNENALKNAQHTPC